MYIVLIHQDGCVYQMKIANIVCFFGFRNPLGLDYVVMQQRSSSTHLDLSKFVHGESWIQCDSPQVYKSPLSALNVKKLIF